MKVDKQAFCRVLAGLDGGGCGVWEGGGVGSAGGRGREGRVAVGPHRYGHAGSLLLSD